jgi:hypothetical protein
MGLLAFSEDVMKRFQDAAAETMVGITVIAYKATVIYFHERSDCHSRVKHRVDGSCRYEASLNARIAAWFADIWS